MIKIIRRCQNFRLVEGFHPLFLPFLAYMGPFLVIFWVFQVGPTRALWPKTCPQDHSRLGNKKIYWHITFNACASNFCEPNFQEFCLKWWRKELFLHHGDELNGLGPSWMVLTHGNVIFDILEHSAFQKYSICWVFRSYSVQPHFQCKLKSSRVQR